MKYNEMHSKIRQCGWKFIYAKGSHYFYEKGRLKSPPIPYHGSKEVGDGLRMKLFKDLNIK